MKRKFAIGTTVRSGVNRPEYTVLGYVETPLGGRMVACRTEGYAEFRTGTPVFHLDQDDFEDASADPLMAIARAYSVQYFNNSCSALPEAIHAALIEARDAS